MLESYSEIRIKLTPNQPLSMGCVTANPHHTFVNSGNVKYIRVQMEVKFFLLICHDRCVCQSGRNIPLPAGYSIAQSIEVCPMTLISLRIFSSKIIEFWYEISNFRSYLDSLHPSGDFLKRSNVFRSTSGEAKTPLFEICTMHPKNLPKQKIINGSAYCQKSQPVRPSLLFPTSICLYFVLYIIKSGRNYGYH